MGTDIVSSFGRLRSIKKLKGGRIRDNLLSIGLSSTGYCQISLRLPEGNYKNYRINRLVAKIFIDNPENKEQVNHIDGNKMNNNISNLEWCSAKENVQHAHRTGLIKHRTGEEIYWSKLTEENVREIKTILRSKTKSHRQIGAMFNVSKSAISEISRGKNWAFVSIG